MSRSSPNAALPCVTAPTLPESRPRELDNFKSLYAGTVCKHRLVHTFQHCQSIVSEHPAPEFSRPATTRSLLPSATTDRIFEQHGSNTREAERRRGHVPNISISDPSHHVTDAIAHMYGSNDWNNHGESARPTFLVTPPADQERREGTYFGSRPSTLSLDKSGNPTSPADRHGTVQNESSTSLHARQGSLASLQGRGSPPQLVRTPSSDTAIQRFPLNDVDYESSPAAVAQELSNLQAIRRMSMSVDNADPDLPSFAHGFGAPLGPPSPGADEDDAARLFWVPASLHPELAPREFKTFVEERVDLIRRKSTKNESLSPATAERLGSQGNLRRKKSRLSKIIDTAIGYEDGAEVLERRRSGQNQHQRKTSETTLLELENIVGHPSHGAQDLGLDSSSLVDSGIDNGEPQDMATLSAGAVPQALKRSTRTNYRRGSLRKGERVAVSKRGAARLGGGDREGLSPTGPGPSFADDETYPLQRAQTEPVPSGATDGRYIMESTTEGRLTQGSSMDFVTRLQQRDEEEQKVEEAPKPTPQIPAFQSRIASAGRTTASLPGYPGPHSMRRTGEQPRPQSHQQPSSLGHGQPLPERKSSHEFGRVNTIHTVPIERPQYSTSKGYHQQKTLDDMANLPSLMPGTNTRTDAVTFIPTFPEDKKSEKKSKARKESSESGRKTGWSSWLRGSDEKDKNKEKRDKEEKEAKKTRSRIQRTPEKPHDTARLDVLQTTSESVRGRESLVLDRESIKIDEERKKEGVRSRVFGGDGKKEKESSLFSSLFGGKQKKADKDSNSSKPVITRRLSPEPQYRPMRADIDYNWTRFSILEERAIYRMAHMKLANPRRALYSQVLLSNFMYSYLAKVQQMHPQIQIPQYITQSMQQQQQQTQQSQQAHMQGEMDGMHTDEFSQWQQYQAQHGQVSYDLNGGAYDVQHAGAYDQNYIDDYDEGHQHQQDAAWQAYPQHDEEGQYSYHQGRHWDERGQYSEQAHFDGTRPPEGNTW